MTGYIDSLLEEIDTNLVDVLKQIVLAHHEGAGAPFLDSIAHEFGLFTLPHIRGLR